MSRHVLLAWHTTSRSYSYHSPQFHFQLDTHTLPLLSSPGQRFITAKLAASHPTGVAENVVGIGNLGAFCRDGFKIRA